MAGFESAMARHGLVGTVIHGEPTFEAGQDAGATTRRRIAQATAAIVVSPGALAGLVAGTYDCGRASRKTFRWWRWCRGSSRGCSPRR